MVICLRRAPNQSLRFCAPVAWRHPHRQRRCRHPHVLVQGKGRKERAVPLTTDARRALATWFTERGGRPDDPVFSTRVGRRLTRDAVQRRVTVAATAAADICPSLKRKRVHPHTLRHSCAMSLLQAGVDSTVIALWLGHADISSTQQYIHADLTIKQRALALLTPPAAKPGRYIPADDVLAYLATLD
jgi:site-specific recombinase XerC